MTISILHPSYGRPGLAAITASKWIQRAGVPVEYILCLTYQDKKLNEYRALFNQIPNVKITYHAEGNMVKQLNHAAAISSGELLVNVSDDFDCPMNWGIMLIEMLTGRSDFAVKTDDAIKVEGINSDNIIALPIMDRVFYNRFGYIYNPAYNHFYGDEELSNVADILGRKIVLPITFEHIHYTMGKAKEDAVNRKNNQFFEVDKATFIKRKQLNFGL